MLFKLQKGVALHHQLADISSRDLASCQGSYIKNLGVLPQQRCHEAKQFKVLAGTFSAKIAIHRD
jgi:hypothetical protein